MVVMIGKFENAINNESTQFKQFANDEEIGPWTDAGWIC